MLRTLIVDDEAPARRKLRRLLDAQPDVEILADAPNGRAAVESIRAQTPDLVFLDIQMPPPNGFGVIDALGRDRAPDVIFVTAFDEHALRAFEVRALDYLLKPYPPERFHAVLSHVRSRFGPSRASPGVSPEPRDANDVVVKLAQLLEQVGVRQRYLRRVLVHREPDEGGRAYLLAVERIDRVAAERNYIRLHTAGDAFLLRSTISAFAERLDPAQFMRISRSDVVRLDAIKELHPWFHGDYRVVLTDGTTLTWSRRYRAESASEFSGRA
jgi:two-component system LytT family response regulator